MLAVLAEVAVVALVALPESGPEKEVAVKTPEVFHVGAPVLKRFGVIDPGAKEALVMDPAGKEIVDVTVRLVTVMLPGVSHRIVLNNLRM